MARIEIMSDTKNKCLSCRFYAYDNNYWLTGKCINENFRGNKDRSWNSKRCVHYRGTTVVLIQDED